MQSAECVTCNTNTVLDRKTRDPFDQYQQSSAVLCIQAPCAIQAPLCKEKLTEWHPEFITKLCQQGDNNRQKLKFIHTVDDPQQGQISRALTENQTSTDLSGTWLNPHCTQQCPLIAQGRGKKAVQSPRACDWISFHSTSWGAAPRAMRINTQWSTLEHPSSTAKFGTKSYQHKYKQGEPIFSLVVLHCSARCCLVLTQATLQDFSARALDPKPAHFKQIRRTGVILNMSHLIFWMESYHPCLGWDFQTQRILSHWNGPYN